MPKIIPAITLFFLVPAVPVSAQDMWESQMDYHREATGSYWSTATSNGIYARAQNRSGSNDASPRNDAVSKAANSRRICADAHRGIFNRPEPEAKRALLGLCAKAGY